MPLSEQNFQILFEQAPLGMALADLQLRLVDVNARLCEMLGYTREELVGQRAVKDVTDPGEMGEFKDLIAQMLRGDLSTHRVEKHCVRKDGSEIPTAVTVSLLRDTDGKPIYFAGMVEDLSDRVKTLERLQFVEEATQDGIWDVDLRTGRYEWSRHLYESVGYRPGELEPTVETVNRLIHPDDVGPMWEAVQRHLRGETPMYETEFRIQHKDGHYFWVLSRGKAMFDASGNAVRMVGSHANITRRKETEDALREARAQAERANRAKDDFLAVLSHELRTPLTPVLTATQMMEEDETLSGEHRELATMIRRNVELEARLIDDLLDLTRIARDKMALNMSKVDLHQSIEQAVRICGADIREKELTVVESLTAHPHVIRADAARIQQVFWNLLKNAVKFSFRGGVIEVTTRNIENNRVEIAISDHGVGIDPQMLPRIFNPFEQGGQDITRQFGGLGLGLAIARVLVDLHGGSIAGTSEGLKKGAAFTVVLPSGAAEETRGGDGKNAAERHGQCRAKILLVEDHDDTRKVMVRYLETIGCAVVPAATMAHALELANGTTFDLVISDIGLPDGLGTDLMRNLAARYGIKGLALSGYGMQEDIRRSREAGFVAHLTKPIDLRRLDEAIRQLVGENG